LKGPLVHALLVHRFRPMLPLRPHVARIVTFAPLPGPAVTVPCQAKCLRLDDFCCAQSRMRHSCDTVTSLFFDEARTTTSASVHKEDSMTPSVQAHSCWLLLRCFARSFLRRWPPFALPLRSAGTLIGILAPSSNPVANTGSASTGIQTERLANTGSELNATQRQHWFPNQTPRNVINATRGQHRAGLGTSSLRTVGARRLRS
jgi:hypothetical protein